jgi:hypothetical protein
MLVSITIIRKTRIEGLGVIKNLGSEDVLRVLNNILFGPIVSMTTFLSRPLQTLLHLKLDEGLSIILFLCFVLISYFLYSAKINISIPKYCSYYSKDTNKLAFSKIFVFLKEIKILIISGIVMLILAYTLTLTTNAMDVGGKGSRVHSAAAIGASILFACICSIIELIGKLYQKKSLVNLILAGFFTLLIGFGFMIQQDYRASWNEQKNFWASFIKLCPDLNQDTVVLLSGIIPYDRQTYKLAVTPYFRLIEIVPEQIYDFSDWQKKPTFLILKPNWQDKIASGKNSFMLNDSTIYLNDGDQSKNYPLAINTSSVILVRREDKDLIYRSTFITISNERFELKKLSISSTKPDSLKEGHIYEYMRER